MAPRFRCRSCNERLGPEAKGTICKRCEAIAAGQRPSVRAGIWRLGVALGSIRFGRIRHLAELVQEARSRSLLVVGFTVILAYFMALTSNSVLVNLPVAALLLAAGRWLSIELHLLANRRPPLVKFEELHQQVRLVTHEEALPKPPREVPGADNSWRRVIGAPDLERSLDSLVKTIVRYFLTDMFYAYLTPDRDLPDEVRALLLVVVAELAKRAKKTNLVTLLTKDLVDLVVDHLDLYRRACDDIGPHMLAAMSTAEREESLKHTLGALGELHPACLSAEYEYKAVRKLSASLLTSCLPSSEAQSRVVLCFTRELVCCCVLLPVLRLARPSFLNDCILSAIPEPSVAQAPREAPPASSAGVADSKTAASTASAASKEPPSGKGRSASSSREPQAALELTRPGKLYADSGTGVKIPEERRAHELEKQEKTVAGLGFPVEEESGEEDEAIDPLLAAAARAVVRASSFHRLSRPLLPGKEAPASEPEDEDGLSSPLPSASGDGQDVYGEDEMHLLRRMRAALPLDDYKTAAELRAGIAGRTGAERSQWLEDYFERQMAVLESDHLDNVWSKGRRYRAKEARLGTDPSPTGTPQAASGALGRTGPDLVAELGEVAGRGAGPRAGEMWLDGARGQADVELPAGRGADWDPAPGTPVSSSSGAPQVSRPAAQRHAQSKPGASALASTVHPGSAAQAAVSAKGTPTVRPSKAYQGLRSWTSSDSEGASEEERRGLGRRGRGDGEDTAEMEVGVAVRGLGFLVPGSPDTMGMLHKQRRRTPEVPPGKGAGVDSAAGSTLGVPAISLGPASQEGPGKPTSGGPNASGPDMPQAGDAQTVWNWFGTTPAAAAAAAAAGSAAGGGKGGGAVAKQAGAPDSDAKPIPAMSRQDWESFLGLGGAQGRGASQAGLPARANPMAPAPTQNGAGLGGPAFGGAGQQSAAPVQGGGGQAAAAAGREGGGGMAAGATFPLSLFGLITPPRNAPDPAQQPLEPTAQEAAPGLARPATRAARPHERESAPSPQAGPLPLPLLQAAESAPSQHGGPDGVPPLTDGPLAAGASSNPGSRTAEGSVLRKRRSKRVILHAPGETLSDSGWEGAHARAATVLSAPGVYPRGQGNAFESSNWTRELSEPGPGVYRAYVIGACTAECQGKQIVAFSINVCDPDGSSWILHRRYRDFERLQNKFRGLPFGFCFPVSLPAKRIFTSRFDRDFIRLRAADLHKYLEAVMALRPEWNAMPLIVEFLDKGSREYGAGIDTRIGSLRPLVNVEDVLSSAAWGSAPSHRVSLSGADLISRSQTEDSGSTPTFGSQLLPRLGPEGEEDEEQEEGEEEEETRGVSPAQVVEGGGDSQCSGAGAAGVRSAEPELEEELRLSFPPQAGLSAMPGEFSSPVARPVRHGDIQQPGLGGPPQDWAVRSEVVRARGGGVARQEHLGGLDDSRSDPGLGAGTAFVGGEGGVRGRNVGDATSSGNSSRRDGGGLAATQAGRQSSATEEDDTVLPVEWSVSNISAPLLNLVDVLFELHTHGWIRRQVVWAARQVLGLLMGDAIDDFLLSSIQRLRNEGVVNSLVTWLHQFLFPNGVFFTRQQAAQQSEPTASKAGIPAEAGQGERHANVHNHQQQQQQGSSGHAPSAPPRPDPLGLNVPPQTYSERRRDAEKSQRLRRLLLEAFPPAVIRVIGWKRCEKAALDVHAFLQSPVFVKQFAHSILELVLAALFPELKGAILEVRQGNL